MLQTLSICCFFLQCTHLGVGGNYHDPQILLFLCKGSNSASYALQFASPLLLASSILRSTAAVLKLRQLCHWLQFQYVNMYSRARNKLYGPRKDRERERQWRRLHGHECERIYITNNFKMLDAPHRCRKITNRVSMSVLERQKYTCFESK